MHKTSADKGDMIQSVKTLIWCDTLILNNAKFQLNMYQKTYYRKLKVFKFYHTSGPNWKFWSYFQSQL